MNSLENLYSGAFFQFTTGRIGWSGVCSLISCLMEGAEGFIFMYFHLESLGSCFIYCLSDMGLKCVCGVCGGCAEIVIENEILYLGLLLVCGLYDNGIAFVCSYYHSLVFAQFVLD